MGSTLDTASQHWWKRPWANIWQPHRINEHWYESDDQLLDLGDGSGDNVGDIWSTSWPYVLCYSAGEESSVLDSLVDAMVDTRPGAGVITAARLGDIDGSGKATLAISYDKASDAGYRGGIVYVQPSVAVPRNGVYRELPEGTGTASIEAWQHTANSGELGLHAEPNPSTGEVHISWNGRGRAGEARLTLNDESGRELGRFQTAASTSELKISLGGYPSGRYFIRLVIGDQSTFLPVLRR